jgi:hypothetical protein
VTSTSEEVQVKTGGIDVEYGQAMGGVVNTVVKSGTNDLSGAISLRGSVTDQFQQASFLSKPSTLRKALGTTTPVRYRPSRSRPIVKDKLFYSLPITRSKPRRRSRIQNNPLPDTIGRPTRLSSGQRLRTRLPSKGSRRRKEHRTTTPRN